MGIVYKGTAVPVYWLVLNKQGNSNQREHIALLQRFINRFGRRGILGILDDREFIGDKTGEWKHQATRPLKTKKHGRPEQSLFRYGLDYLTNSLLQGCQAIEERLRLCGLFLCPPERVTVSGQNPEIMALKM